MDFNQLNNNPQNPKQDPNGMVVASLILGILSIPAGCCYGFGIIFSIISIVFGILSRKPTEHLSTMALAGIICSIIGIVISIAFWISAMIGMSMLKNMTPSEIDSLFRRTL